MSEPSGFLRFHALTEPERQLLRERARAFARVPEEAAAGLIEVLEVTTSAGSFALPLDAVAAVTELSSVAEVPGAPALARGMVSVRGEVLWGVDLSVLVGGASSGLADLRRVVVISTVAGRMGLLAEAALGVRSLPVASFRPDPMTDRSFVVGTNEAFLSLLDPTALLNYAFGLLKGAR
ncbi:MAG: chemotaxis protein CheW [Myxococcaceae bacterium]